MRIPTPVTKRLSRWAHRYMTRHLVDQYIYGNDGKRKLLIRRWDTLDLPFFHVRLHEIVSSDGREECHDHPWWNVTVVIDGDYNEVVPVYQEEWFCPGRYLTMGHTSHRRRQGDVVFRGSKARHKIILDPAVHTHGPIPKGEQKAVSLFIHGRNWRTWGFWDDFDNFTPAPDQRRM